MSQKDKMALLQKRARPFTVTGAYKNEAQSAQSLPQQKQPTNTEFFLNERYFSQKANNNHVN